MRGDDGFDGAVGPRRPVGAVRVTVSAPHVTDASAATGVTDNQESRAQARRGALFLSAVVGAYLAYLAISGQMGTFADALSSVDAGWVLRACLCFASYWVFGVLAYVIAVYLDHDSPVGVRDLMSVEASGVFFGNLTPMMAGAVPAQIYRLTRTGLDVGEASATQFTRFIMFQLGVVLFAAVMLVAKAGYFLEAYGDIFLLNLVVFGVHFLELAGIFVVCLCPRFVMRVGNGAIALADRHGWLRESARWDEMVNVQVMEFSNAFRRAASDLPSMGLTLLVTMAQLASLYMIPWFVLGAFGIEADFLECLAAGSMVQMVASAVPLPGRRGWLPDVLRPHVRQRVFCGLPRLAHRHLLWTHAFGGTPAGPALSWWATEHLRPRQPPPPPPFGPPQGCGPPRADGGLAFRGRRGAQAARTEGRAWPPLRV